MAPFGWIDNPEAVEKVLTSLPLPLFGEAAPALVGTGEKKTVLLYNAYKKLFGKHNPAQYQSRGTCAGRGYSRGVETLACVEIVNGEREEFKSISHAAIYSMARELGGLLGGDDNDQNKDGAVGAHCAKVVSQYGVVSREVAGDKPNNDDLAVKWGSKGCPRDIVKLAREHIVKTVSLIRNASECRDAICNGYPVPVCSTQGFTTKRDKYGRCTPKGSWAHCMLIDGFDHDKNRFNIEQSWGQNNPTGPLYLDQPDNSFWADWEVIEKMMKARDSFSLCGFKGYVARENIGELFNFI